MTGALALALALGGIITAHAEHPIDIQRLSAEGDHFKALSLYELLPHRQFDTDTYVSRNRRPHFSTPCFGVIRSHSMIELV
jgi:hypothetical protein